MEETNFKGFVICTESQYIDIEPKNEDTIYMVTDSNYSINVIYQGLKMTVQEAVTKLSEKDTELANQLQAKQDQLTQEQLENIANVSSKSGIEYVDEQDLNTLNASKAYADNVTATKQNKLTSDNAGSNVTITEIGGVVKISSIGGGGGGVAPNNVSGISITAANATLKIKFSETTCGSDWFGTKVVMKAGEYPLNERDGIMILDNTVKNAYATTPFVQSGLEDEVYYHFAFFPYSKAGGVNYNIANRGIGMPVRYKIMGVEINLSDSNPLTCCKYTDDAVGMLPNTQAWDEFFGYRPCVLEDGQVSRYSNTNGSYGISSASYSENAMVEFPRRGISISTIENILTIKMTDDNNHLGFKYYAHQRGDVNKANFYLGAYKGYRYNMTLRSISGKLPSEMSQLIEGRMYARGNGAGYDQIGFYQITYLQCMFILKYKSLNSQLALGRGYVDNNDVPIKTGGTDGKGMNFGEQTGKLQMRVFGIEDFWGNAYEWVDGISVGEDGHMMTNTSNFQDDGKGAGYIDNGIVAQFGFSGWIGSPQGTTETGFVVKGTFGSATTHFCDIGRIGADNPLDPDSEEMPYRLTTFGGHSSAGDSAGAFNLEANNSTVMPSPSTVARLMFL